LKSSNTYPCENHLDRNASADFSTLECYLQQPETHEETAIAFEKTTSAKKSKKTHRIGIKEKLAVIDVNLPN